MHLQLKNLKKTRGKRGVVLSFFVLLIISTITLAYDENQALNKPGVDNEGVILEFAEEQKVEIERNADLIFMLDKLSQALEERLAEIDSQLDTAGEAEEVESFGKDYVAFLGTLNSKLDEFDLRISSFDFQTSCHRNDYHYARSLALKIKEKIAEVSKKNLSYGKSANFSQSQTDINQVSSYLLKDFLDLLSELIDRQIPYYSQYEINKNPNAKKKKEIAQKNGVSAPPPIRDMTKGCPESDTDAIKTHDYFEDLKEEINKASAVQHELNQYGYDKNKKINPPDFSKIKLDPQRNTNYMKKLLDNYTFYRENVREFRLESTVVKESSQGSSTHRFFDIQKQKNFQEESDAYLNRLRDYYADLYADQADKLQYRFYKSLEVRNTFWEDGLNNLSKFNQSFSGLLDKQCGG